MHAFMNICCIARSMQFALLKVDNKLKTSRFYQTAFNKTSIIYLFYILILLHVVMVILINLSLKNNINQLNKIK